MSQISSSDMEIDYQQATSEASKSRTQPKTPSLPGISLMFGVTNNCVANINFGQSNTNVAYNLHEFERDEMPEEMEKALAEVELDL